MILHTTQRISGQCHRGIESVKMCIVKFLLIFFVIRAVNCNTPVVLWHGIGDDHLDTIKQIIKENTDENIYIKSIRFGHSSLQDFESGIFIHPNDQIAEVCLQIMEDENLKDGFHAVGFSQGAQFL